MIRKIVFRFVMVSIVSLAAAGGILAQTGAQVRGEVKLTKADGTVVPVADAVVEAYRTDAGSGGVLSAKTNKRGAFAFAFMPFGQTFVLAVSAPGIQPKMFPNVTAGREDVVISVSEGDGKKFTEADIRQAVANSPTNASGELTEDQKKAQAEYLKQKAEVESKNKKILEQNAVINAALVDGNAAYNAKNWDLAIAKYTEGYNASPDFAGSAPVLLNNRGAALRERAVARYNSSVKLNDATAKLEAFKAVKADLSEAVDGYSRSLTLLKEAPAGVISDPKIKESQTVTALSGAKDTLRLMAQTEQVDETKMDIAKTILPEYLAIETDAARKEQAKLILGDLYRVIGDADNAIAEYRKVLETSPDNLDAMAGLGLSLVNAGYINNNKEQLQEGSNMLQRFASAAPENHKYKADAVGLIENLKAEQKITPQKSTGGKRKPN